MTHQCQSLQEINGSVNYNRAVNLPMVAHRRPPRPPLLFIRWESQAKVLFTRVRVLIAANSLKIKSVETPPTSHHSAACLLFLLFFIQSYGAPTCKIFWVGCPTANRGESCDLANLKSRSCPTISVTASIRVSCARPMRGGSVPGNQIPNWPTSIIPTIMNCFCGMRLMWSNLWNYNNSNNVIWNYLELNHSVHA